MQNVRPAPPRVGLFLPVIRRQNLHHALCFSHLNSGKTSPSHFETAIFLMICAFRDNFRQIGHLFCIAELPFPVRF